MRPTAATAGLVLALLLGSCSLATLAAGPDDETETTDPGGSHPTVLLQAAADVLTLDDAGRRFLPARWPGPTVLVSISGELDHQTAADIDGVLAWLSDTTGLHLLRRDSARAPMRVTLGDGLAPQVVLTQQGHRILHADVQWDPGHPHARRWMWEELLQAAGPAGDWGPPGTLFSTDQSATGPSRFDRWVLEQLYELDERQLAGDLPAELDFKRYGAPTRLHHHGAPGQ